MRIEDCKVDMQVTLIANGYRYGKAEAMYPGALAIIKGIVPPNKVLLKIDGPIYYTVHPSEIEPFRYVLVNQQERWKKELQNSLKRAIGWPWPKLNSKHKEELPRVRLLEDCVRRASSPEWWMKEMYGKPTGNFYTKPMTATEKYQKKLDEDRCEALRNSAIESVMSRYYGAIPKHKEELPMEKLEGKFTIEEKGRGYIVEAEANGNHKTSVVDGNSEEAAERIGFLIDNIIEETRRDKAKKLAKKIEIENLKKKIAELEN